MFPLTDAKYTFYVKHCYSSLLYYLQAIVFHFLIDSYVKLNFVSYATVIAAIAKSNDTNKSMLVESMLYSILLVGLEPNVVCYNSVLNACSYDVVNGKTAHQTSQRVLKRIESE